MVIDSATLERHLKKEVLRIGIELFRVMQGPGILQIVIFLRHGSSESGQFCYLLPLFKYNRRKVPSHFMT